MQAQQNRNFDLHQARENKKDEFYTSLSDIELEMRVYREQFRDKTVFCNCDDPYESNFFKYFAMNFNFLRLKKLIATCYKSSPVVNTELDARNLFNFAEYDRQNKSHPYKVVITEIPDLNNDGAIDLSDVEALLKSDRNTLTTLNGDGDFRSDECIELLKEADIIVTNPPFSLFREFVATLMKYQKKFIILGNVNAITYKEIFPLIRDDKLWMGQSIHSGDREFRVPDDYPLQASGYRIDEKGNKYIRVKGVRWWTNLDYPQRHEDLILYKKYEGHEFDYPKYDNCDAINVDVTSEIPLDYDGIMGVPITFLDKWNPDQFELLGLSRDMDIPTKTGMKKEFVDKYFEQGNKGQIAPGHPDLCYYDTNGKTIVPYRRMMIRKKV